MELRIQKFLAQIGVASRRRAEELIKEGRVTVNGKVAEIAMRIDPSECHIKVDGKLLTSPEQRVYYLFYKPVGVVSTLTDPEGRACLSDFIGRIKYRLFPVGRLDFNSEGLMILTNDGDLANRILHPSRKIPKTYHVKVSDEPSEASIERLCKGIWLEEGKTAPAKVKMLRKTSSNVWLEMVLYEGRKRQIRRMIEGIGHSVLKLRRVKINGLSLNKLKPGELREMTEEELKRLKEEIQGEGERRVSYGQIKGRGFNRDLKGAN